MQIGDQPPTLSSDEESGSSTSSCEESRDLQNNATPSASGSNSPVPKGSKDLAASNNANAIKKEEVVKTELKSEPMDTSTSVVSAAIPNAVPKKEEEYDSSATMSADERESEPRATTVYMQQPYLPPGIARDSSSTSIRPLGYPGNPRPGERPTIRQPVPPHCGPMVNRPPMAAPLPPSGVANPGSAGPVVLPEGLSKDTITVKELMINVIEKSLSNPNQTAQVQPGAIAAHPSHSTQPPPSPTIQNLLDGSSKPGNKMTNYVREGIGLNPRVGTMAPPRAPPPPQQQQPQQQQQQQQPQQQQQGQQQANDCETLDLSMPRRRESAATPPTFQRDQLPSHRKSPSFASMSSAAAAADVRPPPAHANKVKTEPYLRDISPSSYDGRPLTTPPHGIGGTSPSPGPPRPPSSSSRGIMPPTTQAYMGRNPLPQPSVSAQGRQPALSPKISSKPPLTIQTGSITQGTPVQQGAQQRYGEPLLKMTPPDARVGGGSITQGTPVYDKTARRIQESAYYAQAQAAGAQRSAAAAALAAAAGAAGFADPRLQAPDQHLTSRQVIMNDFAMARSNEMQRRPDSRDAHHAVGRSASPATSRGSLRDLSPRPRTLDSRAAAVAAQLTREAAAGRGPTSSDPRLDPRYIAAASQALAAEAQQQHRDSRNPGLISGLPEPRGDPKADIPNLHKDPRGLQRAQPASTLGRSYFLGPSTTASAMPNQQVFNEYIFRNVLCTQCCIF